MEPENGTVLGAVLHGAVKHFPAVQALGRRAFALATAGVAATAFLTGCGNSYRPVVTAINPVGPSGQPTKYAVAVSNTSSFSSPVAVTAYSIVNNVITVTVPNTFVAGQSVTFSAFPISTFLNGQTVTVLAAGLSATQFSASLGHANASVAERGVVSVTTSLPGLLTFVDFSGDTILSTPSILSNPSYFNITSGGGEGFVINSLGSLNEFGLSNPTGLQTNNVIQTTLPIASLPVTLNTFALGGTQALFVPEAATSKIAVLNTAGPSLIEEISVGANPVYVVGVDSALRGYAISQNASGNGQVAAIEAGTLSVSATIPVGVQPVYGVMSADGKRAFILNKGSGTVSVLNVVNNALDAVVPVITTAIPALGSVATSPVWADFSPLTNEMVVLNAGDGTHQGSLSVINIPLCTSSSQPSNPLCDTGNPVDATGFGNILATVPVGINPSMVSVLRDGTRAYVINQADAKCSAGEGSVSVVNLTTGQLSATVCGISTAAGTASANSSPTLIYGHPNSIAATNSSPTGKVYVTSGDNRYMSVIYTDTDSVGTHITLQGLGVRVLVTQP